MTENALHILLAALAVVLTVTGPDGPCLVTWGVLAALTGWRLFAAYYGEVQAPPPPAAGRPTPPGLPQPFPLPRTHYFGLITGPDASHGGYYGWERPLVRIIQQRLIHKGYVPGITDWNSPWADGIFEQPTADAVARFQHAEMPGTQYFGQVWWDDYAQLAK